MISAALVIMLSTVVFAMSGDGGNVPVVPKNEAVKAAASENVPVEQTEIVTQSTKSNSIETVKDQFGIDTGMPAGTLSKFKEEYLKKEKQMFPLNKTTMLYDFKIDLNKYNEFKIYGVDLKKSGNPIESKTYKENALYSDIVIIGETIKKEKINGADTFKLKIYEIIKGSEVLKLKLGEIPNYFNYFDPMNQEPVIGKKGLYFFGFAQDINKETRRWAQQRTASTLLCLDDNSVVYERNFKTLDYALYYKNNASTNEKMLKSEKWRKKIDDLYNSVKMNDTWNDAVANVKKIIEINDDLHFYKKTFKVEVENEK